MTDTIKSGGASLAGKVAGATSYAKENDAIGIGGIAISTLARIGAKTAQDTVSNSRITRSYKSGKNSMKLQTIP